MAKVVGTPMIEHSEDERIAVVTVRSISEERAKASAEQWLRKHHGIENPETKVSGGVFFQTVLMKWRG